MLAFLFVLVLLTLTSAVNAEPEWSGDKQLTTHPDRDWDPSIHILRDANATIWVVWSSNRTGNYDIWYRTSSDGGANWTVDKQLTTNSSNDDTPSITRTVDGKIWVVWQSNRIGAQDDVYYKTSTDGGASWSAEKRLTNDTNFDKCPSITQTVDGKIWVVWASDRIWVEDPGEPGTYIPQDDIFYKTSTDGGASWSSDQRLTNDTKDDIDPSITQTADGRIWIVWVADRYGNRDIWYRTSSDGGASWSSDQRLTTHLSEDWAPSITQTVDGKIWVVWHSPRNANYDIYYKNSTDGGFNWSPDTRLTTDPNLDAVPSIAQTADGKIWVVWTSNRTGNYDIWYKTSILSHDVAIINITPYSTFVYQGNTLDIRVEVKNEGDASETFNVTAFCNQTAIGTQTVIALGPGANATLTFAWNTTGVPYGYYVISATAEQVPGETDLSDNNYVDGTVQVRIPGDANGDRVVNVIDLGMLGSAWGSKAGDPHYDFRVDFNVDGRINIIDLSMLGGHWGWREK